MRTRSFIRRLTLGTGLLLAFAGPAQADTDGDVVKFQHPYPLTDTTRVAVEGRRVGVAANDAGTPRCRIPATSLSLAPRERAVELRPVSLNLRTCRATFKRGVPPKSSQGSPLGKPRSAGADRGRGGGAGGVSALANGYRWSGYTRAWYTDARTGKVVNEVRTGADWNPNGRCIGSNNVWFRTFPDTLSGWFQVSRRWSYTNTACDSVVSSTRVHFRDRRFRGCSGGPVVDARYRRVRFVGYPNGGQKATRSSSIEPSCPHVLIGYQALYRR